MTVRFGWALRRVGLPAALVYGLLVGAGLLLAHPAGRLLAGEEEVNRDLAAARTPAWTTVTEVFSVLADTASIIGAAVVFALILRRLYGRWTESAILLIAVLLQAVVFLLAAAVVDRRRPDVPHLDEAPPTSSFPSGHAGAATALYLGLAVVVGWRLRCPLPRVLVVTLLASVPVLVAASRLYRGMHHPTDVVFGALNGIACLLIAVRAMRPDRVTRGP